MKKELLKWQVIILLFLFLVRVSPAQEEGEGVKISLTLEECILHALENNLDIKIEVINPKISRVSLDRAKEKFLPDLSFSLNKRNTEGASYSWLDSSDQVSTRFQSYSGEIRQFLPTGGTLTLSLDSDETDTNRNFQTINPRFESTMRLDLTQPLLKNFGFSTNRKEIIVARNNLKVSKSRYKSTLMDIIYSVEEAYWILVYSIENLQVKTQSLELARELLDKNQRSVEIGKLAPIEITSAEAEVASREADILQAESQVLSNEDRLKKIINIKSGPLMESARIIPADQPTWEEKTIALSSAIETARQFRPDLEERKIDLKNKEIELKYAKNQLLPDLNLQASYWSPGISGTQILYKDGDALTGEVIGTIPGGSADSMKDAFKLLYDNWSVGLGLSIPVSSIITRTQVANARLQLEQSKLQLLNKEQQILLDIKNALREVQTNFKRIKAYRLARELTEKKLAAEEEKLNVGKSTNYNVFLFQRDLATAQYNELKAIIDYNLSLAYQEKALGTILKEKNIKVE